MSDDFVDEPGSVRALVLDLQRQVYPTTPGVRRPVANDHARALEAARKLAQALDDESALCRLHALATADDLDVAGAHDIALDLVRVLSSDITQIRAIDRARTLTQTLAQTLDIPYPDSLLKGRRAIEIDGTSIAGRKSRAQQSTAALRLTETVARMLPTENRTRYGEEFGSELADIALAGGGRWAQMAYAVRQVRCVWQLRAELRRRRSGAFR